MARLKFGSIVEDRCKDAVKKALDEAMKVMEESSVKPANGKYTVLFRESPYRPRFMPKSWARYIEELVKFHAPAPSTPSKSPALKMITQADLMRRWDIDSMDEFELLRPSIVSEKGRMCEYLVGRFFDASEWLLGDIEAFESRLLDIYRKREVRSLIKAARAAKKKEDEGR